MRSGKLSMGWVSVITSLSNFLMILVVIASVNMKIGAAARNGGHKEARRQLLDDPTAGFISIDCGLPEDSPGYTDKSTGIFYVPDKGFIETGENHDITTKTYNQKFWNNVRSFPEGIRNCYTLKPRAGRNNRYLIRAIFFYGNYDSQNSLRTFDLHLGTEFWDTITITSSLVYTAKEIIHTPTTDYIDVCLVNTDNGVPFISALELRTLNNDMYVTDSESSLDLRARYDYGANRSTTDHLRYDIADVYDRVWGPIETPGGLIPYAKQLARDEMSNNTYRPPAEVMRTAVAPAQPKDSLELSWKLPNTSVGCYIYLHFFELDIENVEFPTTKFYVDVAGMNLSDSPITLPANRPLTLPLPRVFKGEQINLTISPTNDSTLPPLLNAAEIYIEKNLQQLHTQLEDVDAMISIKSSYRISRNGNDWQGDPCLPKAYLWDGLNCNYDNDMPIITSLNLSRSGLTGEIFPSFANLTSLESLDLSYNNLSGKIPELLADMPSLKLLNLSGNKLTGCVPQALHNKSGPAFTLSLDPHLRVCQKKNRKTKYIVAASITSILVVVLSVAVFVFWKCRRKRSQDSTNEVSLMSKKQYYTYSEIESITNNFERVIGNGASGEVYHGYLEDHTQVAIKILSKSKESSRQFQTEVQLLLRIHHKNLVSFLGYCNEGTNMALIYEYMAKGNLKQNLSGNNPNVLTWKERLHIALDAARGLEYLHNGCKPSIVHRDLKPANILLNETLQAKISDFGISKIFEAESGTHMFAETIAGTLGYLDPEYHATFKLSEKSDVYSFGVILLELITGQPVTRTIQADVNEEGTREVIHLKSWVKTLHEQRDIQNIMDRKLQGDFRIDSATMAIEIALECVPDAARLRPHMGHVLLKLKECLAIELGDKDGASSGVDTDGHDTGTGSSETASVEKASLAR